MGSDAKDRSTSSSACLSCVLVAGEYISHINIYLHRLKLTVPRCLSSKAR